MISKSLGVLFIIGLFATAAFATPITYNITFDLSGGGGPLPTGSFTYDSAAALGFQFSNFFVTWNGVTFDLDIPGGANNGGFTVNEPGSSCVGGAASVFPMLSGIGVCTPTNSITYAAVANGLSYQFFFQDQTTGVNPSVFFIEGVKGNGPFANQTAQGRWSITPATTAPEPSTIVLTFTCGIFLIGNAARKEKLTLPASARITPRSHSCFEI